MICSFLLYFLLSYIPKLSNPLRKSIPLFLHSNQDSLINTSDPGHSSAEVKRSFKQLFNWCKIFNNVFMLYKMIQREKDSKLIWVPAQIIRMNYQGYQKPYVVNYWTLNNKGIKSENISFNYWYEEEDYDDKY